MHCKRLETQAELGEVWKKKLNSQIFCHFLQKGNKEIKKAWTHVLSSQVRHKKLMLSNLWKIRTSHLFHLPCWLTFLSLKLACYHLRRSQLSLRSGYKHVPNYSVQIQGRLFPPWRTSPRAADSTPSTYGANAPGVAVGLDQQFPPCKQFFSCANYLGRQPPKRLWKEKSHTLQRQKWFFEGLKLHAFELCSSPPSC